MLRGPQTAGTCGTPAVGEGQLGITPIENWRRYLDYFLLLLSILVWIIFYEILFRTVGRSDFAVFAFGTAIIIWVLACVVGCVAVILGVSRPTVITWLVVALCATFCFRAGFLILACRHGLP
jgi:fatty acid desaturase